jgi:hypothetical protein
MTGEKSLSLSLFRREKLNKPGRFERGLQAFSPPA